MIDIKKLIFQPETFKEACQKKGLKVDIDALINLKHKQNQLIQDRDKLRHQLNLGSEAKPTPEKIEALKVIKSKMKLRENEIDILEKQISETTALIPNPPFADVPVGKDETGNVVWREVGQPPQFDFEPKDHLQLGQQLDLFDTEKAGEVSGARFFYLKNELVLLEFALIRLVYDTLVAEKFIPMIPPVFIKEKHYAGMGRLTGQQREERYYLPKDELYLVGSAEHTLGPYHADEILEEQELPKRYLGFSTCFRREAGSYGRDVKGILRTHQFDKVEMFSFALPEKSEEEHKFLLAQQEKLMQLLQLPYRVVEICTGDMGFTDARQYDLEVWLPGQNKYRESHSASNTTDFQARGENIKVRRKSGQVEYLHMLNATALAIGRILVAIMENYQTREGWIKVPQVLQKYLSFDLFKRT